MENNQTKEKLLAEIGRLKKELKKKKKYGLVWDSEREPEEVVEMCKEKLPVLKEVKTKEIITDKSKPINLLIEGDNYHALSVLNYTHAKKIDVIYIDPPYNTGNQDFMYNDKYIDKEDGFRHSKWLNFIEKRLELSKNLLKNAGVIFISIDDNEQASLKMLCDEIFGPENFIGMVSVQSTPGGRQSSKSLAVMGDYVIVYGKSQNSRILGLPLSQKRIEQYTKQDKNGKYLTERLRQHGIAEKREDVPTLYFPIFYNEVENKISTIKKKGYNIEILPILPDGGDGRWIWSKQKMDKDKDFIEIRKVKRNGGYVYDAFFKKYLADSLREKLPTIWIESDLRTEVGSKELREIFGGEKVFDFPKPTYFIKRLIQSCTSSNEVILDFMAGSGTTGHAVLQLNKEDGGNRKFILCTNNGDEKSKHKIVTDVCYPRIQKVIKGYKTLKGEKIKGLDGNLKYFKTDFVGFKESNDRNKIRMTEEAIEMLCVKEGTFEEVENRVGFKIFKNHDHHTGIIFDQLAIKEFKKAISNIKGKFSVYIFSLGDDTFDDEFEDMKSKVKLSPIPEAILKVYRKIFK